MAQAIAQQTRQRRRRRSIKVKIQRPRPLATPPSRSDCIDGHLNYAHIVKRAFANWAIFEKLCKKKRRKKAYWSCGSLRATPPFPPSVLSPHGVGKKLRNFLLMLRHKQRRRPKAAQLVSNLSWAVDDVATVAAKRRQTKGKRQCAVELATYLRTARRANPTPLTALAPLSHPSTHNSTHTGASLRHMRGANVKYIKKGSTTTACETPLGGQRLATFPLLFLLLPLPLLIVLCSRPCRVFDYHARLHAKQRNFRHACRQSKPPATLFVFVQAIRRGVKGRHGDGGGVDHSSMGPSRARASSKKNRTKSHLTGVVSGHQHHANISHVANCRARVATRVCQWPRSGGTLVCAMHLGVEMI